ncbi:16S rRNA (cytosine(1402)-N(4))-methyltransferase RsmH [Oribacterium sp. WCC10]|uniref:16S rRNA (cytosine(1402)-N(4))-methyltransferase RsmH n=1 Tax=Oribacterium sp. WCC10 TaxID=1855343 RepID=UPI0008ED05B4|nr:16S rRNA (cytosine(1402)-N(4))-methyltransferase RsmH [Oribacterium sp. WCC10]SFG09546.1 16S rRNA (cytosine1402-N4)-methyltransferase [Oribacterium sp. WCC10]
MTDKNTEKDINIIADPTSVNTTASSESGTGDAPVHRRRKRYSGKYPRKFEEKYKEHQPEKYKEDIDKIIQKGKTPAGMHIPIMVNEILEVLNIKPGEVGMDATLGYGGHTEKMLEKLRGSGHLYATDVDPIESVKTEKRLRDKGYGEDIFTIKRTNFRNVETVADNGDKFDFVLADLGVSSMQIDNPERGFSYKTDGPLDLRLNPESGESAAERLRSLSYDEIVHIFIENSDEPYAEKIAKEIIRAYHKGEHIETTSELRNIVKKALGFLPEKEQSDAVKKSCKRVFQALRIEVNSEFEVLYDFLNKVPDCMNPGGRIAVLTFHSGEDRLVKQFFKEMKRAGIYSDISREVIRPGKEECFINPRAHSTKLRWAIKA